MLDHGGPCGLVSGPAVVALCQCRGRAELAGELLTLRLPLFERCAVELRHGVPQLLEIRVVLLLAHGLSIAGAIAARQMGRLAHGVLHGKTPLPHSAVTIAVEQGIALYVIAKGGPLHNFLKESPDLPVVAGRKIRQFPLGLLQRGHGPSVGGGFRHTRLFLFDDSLLCHQAFSSPASASSCLKLT